MGFRLARLRTRSARSGTAGGDSARIEGCGEPHDRPLFVTHGTLGEALIQCVCHVLDKRPLLLGQLACRRAIPPTPLLARRMIATVDDGEGVLLLADLYGATRCNVATRLIEPGRIELVAGSACRCCCAC